LTVASEAAAELRSHVRGLPRGQQEAVELVYFGGLSVSEAAERLGTTTQAIKTRLFKARVSMRAQFAPLKEVGAMVGSSSIPVSVIDVRRQTVGEPRPHVVVLSETGGARMLPIGVGEWEGTSLAMLLHHVETPRPLTFSFAAAALAAGGVSVVAVTIEALVGDTFIAGVEVQGSAGRQRVDARPSDALALALVAGSPITAAAEVMEACGLGLEGWDPERPAAPGHPLPEEPYADDAEAIVADVRARWLRAPEPPAP
jgi:bifunctional DNase/RNase